MPACPPPLQADPVAAGTHIDEDIVREVVRLGFTREFVTDSLKARQQNKVRVAGRAGWRGCAADQSGGAHQGNVKRCAAVRERGPCNTSQPSATAMPTRSSRLFPNPHSRHTRLTPRPTSPPPAPQASVAYYLMADNRRRMPSSAYLKEEMTEATDVNLQYPSGEHAVHQHLVSNSWRCAPPLWYCWLAAWLYASRLWATWVSPAVQCPSALPASLA